MPPKLAHTKLPETLCWLLCIAILVFCLRQNLFEGTYVFSWDNYFWSYPIFHYFSNSLAHFTLPLWNPYSHGGEPFYPILGTIRLLDPLVFPIVWLCKLLQLNSAQSFAWYRVIGGIILAWTTHYCLADYAKERISRLVLIPILLLSSYVFGSFRQEGLFLHAFWLPFIYLFYDRIFFREQNKLSNWLGLAACLGVNWLCYFFVEPWIFLALLICGQWCFDRKSLLKIITAPQTKRHFMGASLVILLMALPGIVLFIERDDYIYPARMLDANTFNRRLDAPMQYEGDKNSIAAPLAMNYSFAESTGTFSTPWDFLLSLYIRGNHRLGFSQFAIGNPSEAPFYLGIWGWILGLVGLFYGKHRLKKIWLSVLLFYALLMLGPGGGLFQLIYSFFPPIWFVRHTHTLFPFVHIAFFFFILLGCDFLLKLDWSQFKTSRQKNKAQKRKDWQLVAQSILFAIVVSIFLYAITAEAELSSLIFWLSLLSIVVIAYFLQKIFRTTQFLLPGILLGQIGIIIWQICGEANISFFLQELLFFGLMPLLLSLFLLECGAQKTSTILAPLFLGLIVNIFISTSWYKAFYTSVEALKENSSHTYPLLRATAPTYSVIEPEQAPRYLELLELRPYAFTVLAPKDNKIPFTAPYTNDSLEFFQFARHSRRWNSYSVLKNYFNLVHSPISDTTLYSMFAIHRSVFSFRQAAVILPEGQWQKALDTLSPTKQAKLLDTFIFAEQATKSTPTTEWPPEISLPKNIKFEATPTFFENQVIVRTNSAQDGLLYWADGYHKYWQATLDGHPVEILRANMNFKAVALPAGEHLFEFRFEPLLFKVTLAIFYLAFLIAMAFVFRKDPHRAMPRAATKTI